MIWQCEKYLINTMHKLISNLSPNPYGRRSCGSPLWRATCWATVMSGLTPATFAPGSSLSRSGWSDTCPPSTPVGAPTLRPATVLPSVTPVAKRSQTGKSILWLRKTLLVFFLLTNGNFIWLEDTPTAVVRGLVIKERISTNPLMSKPTLTILF